MNEREKDHRAACGGDQDAYERVASWLALNTVNMDVFEPFNETIVVVGHNDNLVTKMEMVADAIPGVPFAVGAQVVRRTENGWVDEEANTPVAPDVAIKRALVTASEDD